MGRGLGFHQQQYYGNDGMTMDIQAQQQSYGVHEQAGGSNNGYHKQFPGMHMKPDHAKFGGSPHAMHQESSWHAGHHDSSFEDAWHGSSPHHAYVSGGKKFPFTASTTSHFSNGDRFINSGGHHGYYSEEVAEYDTHGEEHYGPATMKQGSEMRYDGHNWGAYNAFNPNSHEYDGNMNCKPRAHGFHQIEWKTRGI